MLDDNRRKTMPAIGDRSHARSLRRTPPIQQAVFLTVPHRGIKGRCRPMLGLKSTGSARRYCRGHETIEHILPRSPGTAWQAVIGADPSIVSECVQRLGNLCLLLEGSNRGLGRASFRDNFLSAASIIGLTCLEPSILSDPTYSLVRGGVAGPYHVIWILKSGILFSRLKKVER